MNTSTEINIDLPKLPIKPLSIFHSKLQKLIPPNFIIKHSSKKPDETGRLLVQRYKT
jgi:hypothetical protein